MKFNRFFFLLFIPLTSWSQVDSVSFLQKSKKDVLYTINLGNIGLPENSLVFMLKERSPLKVNPDFFIQQKEQHFFLLDSTLTEIGLKTNYGNQSLSVFHTQNINKKANFSSSYLAQNSEGLYLNQSTDHSYFTFSTHFLNQKEKFHFFLYYENNKNNFKQNGGIKNDSVFKNTNFTFLQNIDRSDIEVNLTNAQVKKRSNNVYALSKYYFKSPFIDSLSSNSFYSALYHKISYSNKRFLFEDLSPSEDFYSSIYLDSNKTLDTTYLNVLTNRIGLSNTKYNTNLYLEIKNGKYGFVDFDSFFYKIKLGFSFEKKLNRLHTTFDSYYIPFGLYHSSYSFLFNADLDLGSNSISFSSLWAKKGPFLFENNYKSNHFIWENNFDLINQHKTEISFVNIEKNIQLTGRLINIKNYIYYNQQALPDQISNTVRVSQFFVNKGLRLKKINFHLSALYQKSFSDVIRTPSFISKFAISYNQNILKNKAIIQYGISGFYFSSYYANAYMPSTGLFYLQDNIQVGNYPIINLYLNIKVKDVTLEMILDHLNSGMMGFNYFYLPHYPISDRYIRFGVNWVFLD